MDRTPYFPDVSCVGWLVHVWCWRLSVRLGTHHPQNTSSPLESGSFQRETLWRCGWVALNATPGRPELHTRPPSRADTIRYRSMLKRERHLGPSCGSPPCVLWISPPLTQEIATLSEASCHFHPHFGAPRHRAHTPAPKNPRAEDPPKLHQQVLACACEASPGGASGAGKEVQALQVVEDGAQRGLSFTSREQETTPSTVLYT